MANDPRRGPFDDPGSIRAQPLDPYGPLESSRLLSGLIDMLFPEVSDTGPARPSADIPGTNRAFDPMNALSFVDAYGAPSAAIKGGMPFLAMLLRRADEALPAGKVTGKIAGALGKVGRVLDRPEAWRRFEAEGEHFGSTAKPQGLYTGKDVPNSPFAETGPQSRRYFSNPDAAVLRLDATDFVPSNRGPVVGQSAGVAAFRHLKGADEYERLIRLKKPDLIEEMKREYPGYTQWDRFNDQQEIIEAAGGLEARRAGYDAIRAADRDAHGFTEYVGLNDDAFLNPFDVPKAAWDSRTGRQIRDATESGRWDTSVKRRNVYGFADDGTPENYSYNFRFDPKDRPGMEPWPEREGYRSSRKTLWDSEIARIGESGRLEPIPGTGYSEKVPFQSEEGFIYRGISAEELDDIRRTGRIKSTGEGNFASQQGYTLFSEDPSTAGGYASSFTLWNRGNTRGHPGYVLKVRRPADAVTSKSGVAIDGYEVAIPHEVSADDIVAISEARPMSEHSGFVELSPPDILDKTWREGSRSSPGSSASLFGKPTPFSKPQPVELIPPANEFGYVRQFQVVEGPKEGARRSLAFGTENMSDEMKERIVPAVLDKKEGLVMTGPSHPGIYAENSMLGDPERFTRYTDGFIDRKTGDFYDRQAASELSKRSRELKARQAGPFAAPETKVGSAKKAIEELGDLGDSLKASNVTVAPFKIAAASRSLDDLSRTPRMLQKRAMWKQTASRYFSESARANLSEYDVEALGHAFSRLERAITLPDSRPYKAKRIETWIRQAKGASEVRGVADEIDWAPFNRALMRAKAHAPKK